MKESGSILIVDDDPGALASLGEVLERDGHQVTLAASGDEALRMGQELDFDIVLSDLRMRGVDGLQVLRWFKARRPETVLIVMTAFASMDTVVEAISAGAYDYISKPFKLDDMRLKVRQSFKYAAALRENRELKAVVQERQAQDVIIGSSPPMVEVFKTMAKVATADATVLIQGESGTGKELVARSIHRLGRRKEKPFMAVNCASVTESLLESELFGYVRGAFTGATAPKRGIFEAADRGTVFLDEIADTSPAMQAKLLRVLESGEILPVGGNTVAHVDVRIVAATHRDLTEQVTQGRFREDLYYRLKVVTIQLPPLRERISDLPLLFDHFLKKYSSRKGVTLAVQTEVLGCLQRYSWPGNIRQLENVVERAVALNTSGVFGLEDLPQEILTAQRAAPSIDGRPWLTLEQMELRYIQELLEATQGNMTRTAEILGIDRRTLYRKLERTDRNPDTDPSQLSRDSSPNS